MYNLQCFIAFRCHHLRASQRRLCKKNACARVVTSQDFCICIEMFLAALGHYFSFSYRPFIDAAATYNDCWHSFWSMWDVSDVQRDVAEHIRHVGKYDARVPFVRLDALDVRLAADERQPNRRYCGCSCVASLFVCYSLHGFCEPFRARCQVTVLYLCNTVLFYWKPLRTFHRYEWCSAIFIVSHPFLKNRLARGRSHTKISMKSCSAAVRYICYSLFLQKR